VQALVTVGKCDLRMGYGWVAAVGGWIVAWLGCNWLMEPDVECLMPAVCRLMADAHLMSGVT